MYSTGSAVSILGYSESDYSPSDVEGTLLWISHLQGAEKYYRESLPRASGGCHRLFNKGRHLREQLGEGLEG